MLRYLSTGISFSAIKKRSWKTEAVMRLETNVFQINLKWLWKATHVPKVMGSNPGTIYNFSHIFVVNIAMVFV